MLLVLYTSGEKLLYSV